MALFTADLPPTLLIALAGLVALALLTSRLLAQDTHGLPPGPKPHWLTGNKIPQLYSWRYFAELTEQYGGVFTIWQGRTPLVVIGTVDAADELLERQAAYTADRPRQFVADEILSQGARSLLVGYNERWRRMRKAVHVHSQPAVAKTYESLQERLASNVLSDILANPDQHQHAVKVYAASLVLNIAYGKTSRTTFDDPYIQAVIRNSPYLAACLRPGAWLVNSYPWMRFLPFTLGDVRQWSANERELFRTNYENVRKNMAAGKQQPCLVTWLIEHQKEYGMTDEECWWTSGTLYQAGSDTTAAAISVATMAATVSPAAQKRAQEELDRVVGRDRMPSFTDMDDLPYVSAFVKEVFRWRPVSSGGFQHATIQDLHYGGYRIPKGTAIVGNHWSIHRDPKVFPSPDSFQPERWLRADDMAQLKSDKEQRHYGFGFGRRVCAGVHVAHRSVWINTARLLWSFDMTEPVGADGKAGKIDTLAFSNSVNSYPLPFKVDFKPRHDGVLKAIRATEGGQHD